jgi:hypothetical protein
MILKCSSSLSQIYIYIYIFANTTTIGGEDDFDLTVRKGLACAICEGFSVLNVLPRHVRYRQAQPLSNKTNMESQRCVRIEYLQQGS